MYTCLLNNQVPKNWEAAAYPSLKPLASWVKDFHARIAFMRDWLQNGQPSVFWMSGFFFPQVHARARVCVAWHAPSPPPFPVATHVGAGFFLLPHPVPPCAVTSFFSLPPSLPPFLPSFLPPALPPPLLQGFTTGTLQNHARKYGVAIDALSFGFTVLHSYTVEEMKEEEGDVPTDGVLVHGLFMDGARWDRDLQLLGVCMGVGGGGVGVCGGGGV
jgi:hypothetical protein